MTRFIVFGAVVLTLAGAAPAAEEIDGRSAPRWQACPGWAPGRDAPQYAVREAEGWLEFTVSGRDKVMTWLCAVRPAEAPYDPRYLVVRYRAFDLNRAAGDYFLLARGDGRDRHFLMGCGDLAVDGKEHVRVFDLLRGPDAVPADELVLRMGAAGDKAGRLLIKAQFAYEPPPGVEVPREPPPEVRHVRLECEKLTWSPCPDWTPQPPEKHSLDKTDAGVRFRMSGRGRSMRWSVKPAEAVDLAAMPHVTLRYRARGHFGPYGYVLNVGGADSGGKWWDEQVVRPDHVEADGQWHVLRRQATRKGLASALTVGIDSLGPEAEIEVDFIEFSSAPVPVDVQDVLPYEVRGESWPGGKEGLTAVPLAVGATPPGVFFWPRLGLGGWLKSSHVTVGGVPFDVPSGPDAAPTTGTVGEDVLTVDLPGQAREVLLLLAAAFPAEEMFGLDYTNPAALRRLSEPERMTVDLTYADGTCDAFIPIHAATGQYGVGHDIGVYAVRPAAGKKAVRLTLRDRMRNASFGLLGVTVNEGEPRVPEPAIPLVWYPPVKKPAPAPAAFSFAAEKGLSWQRIESAMLGNAVDLAGAPVFTLKVGGRDIPSTQWTVGAVEKDDQYFKAAVTYDEGGLALRGTFEARKTKPHEVLLTLDLANAGDRPVTGTLLFPQISGLKIGKTEDTWYFATRSGGVINRVPCEFRDPIGELHALQIDGFFNPAVGAGVALMPRDLEGVFRWYRLAKDAAGGSYALEFMPRTVEPGGKWESVPVAVAVIPGDWKDQFRDYLAWVRTWYKPQTPRKPWFREVFAFDCATPTGEADFLERAQRTKATLGVCDYLHLFDWAATPKFGHWGEYDHFYTYGKDEADGKRRFAEAVQRCRKAGAPLGLYLDGYLVSNEATKPSREGREKWAIRGEDGKLIPYYDTALSMCPYVPAWREYLTGVYQRVVRDLGPDGVYIDEFGRNLLNRTCWARDHGHPVPMGMSPGEQVLTRQVRAAMPPEVAFYSEYVPSDVAGQYQDGAFCYSILVGYFGTEGQWSNMSRSESGSDRVAPHYVNLQRFVFPDFKTFHLIFSAPHRSGNWFLNRYPFFNGDGTYLNGEARFMCDETSRAFYAKVFRLQHAFKDAFTSADVEPLVPTEAPHLFANRFTAPARTVWTVYNANYRTLRGHLMTVSHRSGAKYRDAWNDRPIEFRAASGGRAELVFDIGPRSLGCVVQE